MKRFVEWISGGTVWVRNVLLLVFVIIIMTCGILINISGSLWGGFTIGNFIASVLYILFWIWYCISWRNDLVPMKLALVHAVLMFITTFVAAVYVQTTNLPMIFLLIALIGGIITTPLHGIGYLCHFFDFGFTELYAVCTVLAFAWVIYCSSCVENIKREIG